MNNFDTLLSEFGKFARSKAESPPPSTMTKSFSPPSPPMPSMKAVLRELTTMKTKIDAENARFVANEIAKRDRFFKSLADSRQLLGRRIAEGKITADNAIRAEVGLNHLEARALNVLAAEVNR